MSKKPGLVYISTFAVTAAYTWSAMVKSAAAAGEAPNEDGTEVLFLPADGRGRPNALVDPLVPENYFGNCLGNVAPTVEHKKLAVEEGFVAAAEVIADLIKNGVNNKEIFLGNMGGWFSEMSKLARLSTFGVSGSPKFDFSNADFGWGKARRLEVWSMDEEKYSMSLYNSSDFEGGLVVRISLPRKRMEAFATIF